LSLAAFCKVARRNPDLLHVIIGKATGDDYHQSLLAMARDAGVAERVLWRGNVSEDEKLDLLRGAMAFVHTPVTSQDGGFEGFGIVYLEASACGVPVVGTRDSGAEDAIDEGVTGLLVDPEVDAVAAAIERLRSDEGLRRRLGAGGLERARRSSWTENARAVLAIYERVLREARS
jgi:phosphatidylinositol alpha-1,6-mannosyltransferase